MASAVRNPKVRARPSGISVLGDVPWGTHLCQFYKTKDDLLDIVVPYLKAGLESNEFCMWITSDPLSPDEALQALERAVPNLGQRVRAGQLLVLPHTEWYLKNGGFHIKRVLDGWIDKLTAALARGYDGLRLSGNTTWLRDGDWQDFSQYERTINDILKSYQMIALCTYALDQCVASQVIDVVKSHEFALIRREGEWELIESSDRQQARETLRRTRDFLEKLIDYANAPIIVWDPTFRITQFNHAFERLTGYSADDVIGQHLDILFPEASREESIEKISRTLSGEHWESVEIPILRTDGGIRLALWNSANIYDEDGKTLLATIAQGQDITERKMAEDRLRFLSEASAALASSLEYEATLSNVASLAVSTIADGCVIHMVGEDGSIEPLAVARSDARKAEWGKELRHIFPKTPDSPFGPPAVIRTGQSQLYPDISDSMLAALAKGDAVTLDVLRKIGYRSAMVVPVWGRDRVLGAISLICSHSGRHFSQADLALAEELGHRAGIAIENARLYREVQSLNEHLRRHAEELQAANRELEAFSYSVSHDLRAPLRAMDGFSRILVQDYHEHLPQEAQRYLRLVRDSARQMGRLIDDLLMFSRLGRQPVRRQAVLPGAAARQALDDLRPEQEDRRIDITIDDMPMVWADPALLKQVYANLLSNALKFTRNREVAVIEVGCRRMADENVYFVKDNGVGFDMRYAEKVFGVFQRLHRAEEYEGTGVGLAIVQRILHRHGGRIWAEAEVDRGAVFYFTVGGAASANDNAG